MGLVYKAEDVDLPHLLFAIHDDGSLTGPPGSLCRGCEPKRTAWIHSWASFTKFASLNFGVGGNMKTIRMATFLLFCSSALACAQQAPDGLQFNVTYLCNDGHAYVVHRCEKGPKFEMCFYQREHDSERYNKREAVAYQMTKMCKVQGPAATVTAPVQQSSALNDSRWDCSGGATVTVVGCQKQAGQEACWVRLEQNGRVVAQVPKRANDIQTQVRACKPLSSFNPAYLAEFPNPYRVVQGMLVGKPQENVVRAIGAFYQLGEIIQVLAGSRPLTPDEQKFLGDYSRVQSELAEAGAKKFPGQQFDPASNPYRYKRTDPRFGFEGIPVWTTFLTTGTQDAFARIIGGNDDQYAMAVSHEKSLATQQLQNEMKAEDAEAHYAKDPGSVAMRHCLESGRSQMECLGEGLSVGAVDLMGLHGKGVADATAGLRLTGNYSAEHFWLSFGQETVNVVCGKLIPQALPYSVERSGMQLTVKIPIAPKPLILSYKLDGNLAGPGPVEVAGQVVIGGTQDHASTTYQMQTQTSTTQRQIDAGDVPNHALGDVHQNGMEYSVDQQTTSTSWTPTTTHHYSVPTAAKTERCNVGTLPPTGEAVSASGMLTQVAGTKASQSSNTAPGLRLDGTYAAAGGLKIEFRDDSATLECGESFHSEGYAVLPERGQLVVKFQNGTGPLSLVLQPNGTLTGDGTVDVAGRRAIQSESGKVEYLPRNGRCALGTLQAAK